MKIFNNSGRTYDIGRISLGPNSFTEIPPDLEKAANTALSKFSHELTLIDPGTRGAAALNNRVKTLTAENTELKAQVTKMQTILLSDEKSLAKELQETKAALAIAQSDLRKAVDEVHSLQSASALKEDKLAAQAADIEKLTAPPAKP